VEAEKHSSNLNVVKGFKVEDISEKKDFKYGGGGDSGSSSTRGCQFVLSLTYFSIS
jgi:hypothetical protein